MKRLKKTAVYRAPLYHATLLVFQPSQGQSDVRQMKLFCVEDEQARLCWTTGMRFVKVG